VGYQLGLDIGTASAVAAVYKNGRPCVVPIGRSPDFSPMLAFGPRGEILTGEAAVEYASIRPEHAIADLKRRLADSHPILIEGLPHPTESLLHHVMEELLAQVIVHQGGVPNQITVSHPAEWGPFETGRLKQAIAGGPVPPTAISMVPEAIAVARNFACHERLAESQLLLVGDIGAGYFSTAVVQAANSKLKIVGQPKGLSHFGGIELDQIMLDLVTEQVDLDFTSFDLNDADTRNGLVELGLDITAGRERLSSSDSATVVVDLPTCKDQAVVSRVAYEERVKPHLADMVSVMSAAINSAALKHSEISQIVLAGGPALTPCINTYLSASLGLSVAIVPEPTHSGALGAAAIAAQVPIPLIKPRVTRPPMPPTATGKPGAKPKPRRDHESTLVIGKIEVAHRTPSWATVLDDLSMLDHSEAPLDFAQLPDTQTDLGEQDQSWQNHALPAAFQSARPISRDNNPPAVYLFNDPDENGANGLRWEDPAAPSKTRDAFRLISVAFLVAAVAAVGAGGIWKLGLLNFDPGPDQASRVGSLVDDQGEIQDTNQVQDGVSITPDTQLQTEENEPTDLERLGNSLAEETVELSDAPSNSALPSAPVRIIGQPTVVSTRGGSVTFEIRTNDVCSELRWEIRLVAQDRLVAQGGPPNACVGDLHQVTVNPEHLIDGQKLVPNEPYQLTVNLQGSDSQSGGLPAGTGEVSSSAEFTVG